MLMHVNMHTLCFKIDYLLQINVLYNSFAKYLPILKYGIIKIEYMSVCMEKFNPKIFSFQNI